MEGIKKKLAALKEERDAALEKEEEAIAAKKTEKEKTDAVSASRCCGHVLRVE